ncbi:MAG: GNAT family N-acetyltransferase [Deltaproteobacteria bacterium]|nr:GNAT family N-acetyltransferase [Kofleriaceae bacterium]
MSLPNGIALRRARPGDAPGVRSLVEQLGYAPDSRAFSETFTQVARHPEAAVFVLAEGTRVVGYLAVSHRPQIRLGGRVAVIDELAVDPAYGERGLGSHLLAQALELARGLACVRIEVATARSRDSFTRGFYRRHGFVEADTALMRLI